MLTAVSARALRRLVTVATPPPPGTTTSLRSLSSQGASLQKVRLGHGEGREGSKVGWLLLRLLLLPLLIRFPPSYCYCCLLCTYSPQRVHTREGGGLFSVPFPLEANMYTALLLLLFLLLLRPPHHLNHGHHPYITSPFP